MKHDQNRQQGREVPQPGQNEQQGNRPGQQGAEVPQPDQQQQGDRQRQPDKDTAAETGNARPATPNSPEEKAPAPAGAFPCGGRHASLNGQR